ncbi:hypothetical protein D3C76_391000 [compost metagenome]
MATYPSSARHYVRQEVPTLLSATAWTNTYRPGQEVPTSGIYRCLGCGSEIASNQGTPFPPQNHHQHRQPGVGITWQLIVKTN